MVKTMLLRLLLVLVKKIPHLIIIVLLQGIWTNGIALSFDDARHLLVRTGFNASIAEIDRFKGKTRTQAVEDILLGIRTSAINADPKWSNDPLPDFKQRRKASATMKKVMFEERRNKGIELQAWWYKEMVETPSPLTERLVLFWHNHFTSSLKKVKHPQLILQQNKLLRKYALGSYSELLHRISFDPAMLIYLDNNKNRKAAPNENFARELLELFTLGEGNYTEADIKSVARAFTGHGTDRKTGRHVYRLGKHDSDEKTFLGVTGDLDGAAVLDVILAQAQTGVFISEKLWLEFITLSPTTDQLSNLASKFRNQDYQIKDLLRNILLSEAFWSEQNRGTRIKAPVELIVGTVRQFGTSLLEDRKLLQAGYSMGQEILNPPNVKGWSGGKAWINSDYLLSRYQVLRQLNRMANNQGTKGVDGIGAWRKNKKTIERLLLAVSPVDTAKLELARDFNQFRLALINDLSYQLN